jgi:hypothetical protein
MPKAYMHGYRSGEREGNIRRGEKERRMRER